MVKPILYYEEHLPHQHCDGYTVGPCCPCNPIPPCPIPVRPTPVYHGKVSVIGRTVLTVKYLDANGHYQKFDIVEGNTYEFTAVSSTQGVCKFAAKVKDFESNKGIDKLINSPHEITVDALILDASDAYESKLIRVYVNNITSIKPILVFDGDMNYPTTNTSTTTTTCDCGCEQLVDPFAEV